MENWFFWTNTSSHEWFLYNVFYSEVLLTPVKYIHTRATWESQYHTICSQCSEGCKVIMAAVWDNNYVIFKCSSILSSCKDMWPDKDSNSMQTFVKNGEKQLPKHDQIVVNCVNVIRKFTHSICHDHSLLQLVF